MNDMIPVDDKNIFGMMKILIDHVVNDNFYENIYNKFMYVPLSTQQQAPPESLTGVKFIVNYYPVAYNCTEPITSATKCLYKIHNENQYTGLNPTITKEYDSSGEEYYYRVGSHLEKMFDDDYYDYITLNGIATANKNPINQLYFKWRKYVVCPTLDPIHKNHMIIVAKEKVNGMQLRAHHFYTPPLGINIFRDMIDFAKHTGFYVYNSIELGSIPEVVHFHTSDETPPLNDITDIAVKNNVPFCESNDKKITMYRVQDSIAQKLPCHKAYYFELSDDENTIDQFCKILPSALHMSRYVNKSRLSAEQYKYMSQVFICPSNKRNIRIVVTFRRVDRNYARLIQDASYYPQEYYDQIFGKNNVRYNILGYEHKHMANQKDIAVQPSAQDLSKIATDIERIHSYCNDVFHFNTKFEDVIRTKLIGEYIAKYLHDNHLCNKFVKSIYNYITDSTPLIFSAILPPMLTSIDTLNSLITENYTFSNHTIGVDRHEYRSIIIDDRRMCSVHNSGPSPMTYITKEDRIFSRVGTTITIKDKAVLETLAAHTIYNFDKNMSPEPLYYYVFGSEARIISTSVKTTFKSMHDIEKSHNSLGLDNMIRSFIIQVLYELYMLNKEINFNYKDLTIDDILISDKYYNNKHLDMHYRFNHINKFIIPYNGTNIAHYGHVATIGNLYKSSFNIKLKNVTYTINNPDNTHSIDENIISFARSMSYMNNDLVNEILGIIQRNPHNLIEQIIHSPVMQRYNNPFERSIVYYPMFNSIKTSFIPNGATISEIDAFKALHDAVLKNKDKIRTIIQTFNITYSNKIIEIPDKTMFITGTKQYQNGDNPNKFIYNSRDDLLSLPEEWYTCMSPQSTWLLSNYNLLGDDPLNNTMLYDDVAPGISQCTGDFYIGTTVQQMGRHLIFEMKQKSTFLRMGDYQLKSHETTLVVDLLDQLGIIDTTQIRATFPGTNNAEQLIVLIFEILRDYLKIDGYISVDNLSPQITGSAVDADGYVHPIEYIIFDPSRTLKFVGMYYYDYVDDEYILFMNRKNWLDYVDKKIIYYKKIETITKNHESAKLQKYTEYLNDAMALAGLMSFDYWSATTQNKIIKFDDQKSTLVKIS